MILGVSFQSLDSLYLSCVTVNRKNFFIVDVRLSFDLIEKSIITLVMERLIFKQIST